MFKNLKEKKLGDKGSPKPKASTPQKVPSEGTARDNSVDANTTAQAVTPSNHQNEKQVSSTNTPEVVTVTASSNSSQENPKRVR